MRSAVLNLESSAIRKQGLTTTPEIEGSASLHEYHRGEEAGEKRATRGPRQHISHVFFKYVLAVFGISYDDSGLCRLALAAEACMDRSGLGWQCVY